MEPTEPKLEFFDDIKSQLILVLGGIISLTTVIPAFLNSTCDIFGWDDIRWGYYVFVFIYFIIPYLFYLAYCSIHDNVGFLELLPDRWLQVLKKKRPRVIWLDRYSWDAQRTSPVLAFPRSPYQWEAIYNRPGRLQKMKLLAGFSRRTLAEQLLTLAIFLYLLCPSFFVNTYVSIMLVAVSLGYFLFFLVFFMAPRYNAIHGLWKEYRLIGLLLIGLFAIFFAGIIKKAREIPINYSILNQEAAFDAFNANNALKKDVVDVVQYAKETAYKYRVAAGAKSPDRDIRRTGSSAQCPGCNFKGIYLQLRTIDNNKHLTAVSLKKDSILLRQKFTKLFALDSSFVKTDNRSFDDVFQVEDFCFNLYDYAAAIQRAKLAATGALWAKQLKVLQIKSLCWFFFLLLISLCLWLKMQAKLKLDSPADEADQQKISDNIGQIKALILLLFVLIVPWFRQIDAASVDLTRPFLNVTLSGLASGSYNSREQDVSSTKTVMDSTKITEKTVIIFPADTIRIHDTVRIASNNYGLGAPFIDRNYFPFLDSMKADMDSSFNATRAQIQNVANHVIANPAERYVNPKKP
jgi:hypothetical protein